MIKVLVVDDSPVAREFLVHLLACDPAIEVVATAADGEEAIEAVTRARPDVVTMDIHMPKMNGFEATRTIMQSCPTPIVIVTGSPVRDEVATSFQALEAGALTVMTRPTGLGHADHAATVQEFLQTVKLMSEIKVVRRWARREAQAAAATASPEAIAHAPLAPNVRLVAIGASTGGPPVLKDILSALPKDFSAPLLIVQHIAPGFTEGFAEWLAQSSGFPVHLATHGQRLRAGQAYVAPDGCQLGVEPGETIALSHSGPVNGHQPSVSHLFQSVATVFGRHAVGVLLTGMGNDGACELKLMQDRGAVTIAQDRDSSVVHGMPGEAIRLGAASYVLSPSAIAATIRELVNKAASGGPGKLASA